MTNQYPEQDPPPQRQWDNSGQPTGTKPSLWQRFKGWPLLGKVGAVFLVLALLGGVMQLVDPDGPDRRAAQAEDDQAERDEQGSLEEQEVAEQEAEEETQRQAHEEAEEESERRAEEDETTERDAAAEEESERQPQAETDEEREEQEAAEASEEEPEADARLEGIEAQAAAVSDVRDFEDAEIRHYEGNLAVEVEVGPGWSESSMCRGAREQTIRGLQYFRDNVDADYGQVGFSYFTRSEPDATGSSSILSMAGVYYNRDTVESIQDDSVMIANVWEAADEGGKAIVCERAER